MVKKNNLSFAQKMDVSKWIDDHADAGVVLGGSTQQSYTTCRGYIRGQFH